MTNVLNPPSIQPENLDDCIDRALDNPHLPEGIKEQLIVQPRCPMIVFQELGDTALFEACEGCPVWDQIQAEREQRQLEYLAQLECRNTAVEAGRKIITRPSAFAKDNVFLFNNQLRAAGVEYNQLVNSKDALMGARSKVAKAASSTDHMLRLAKVVEDLSGSDDVEHVSVKNAAEALQTIYRRLTLIYPTQANANNGRANGRRIETEQFTELMSALSVFGFESGIGLDELERLIKQSAPNGGAANGINKDTAEALIQGTKGEVAFQKAIEPLLRGGLIRRGTAEEDKKGGDFVVTATGQFIDFKTYSAISECQAERKGNKIELRLPGNSVGRNFELPQKIREQLLGLLKQFTSLELAK